MKYHKSIKYVSIVIASLLLFMVVLPLVLPKTISDNAKKLVNNSLDGKLDFKKARLSFFNHFPNLTVTIYDFSLTGSAPFEKETLASGREFSLGINLLSVFGKNTKINGIYLEGARFNILRGKDGSSNYNILKSEPTPNAEDSLRLTENVGSSYDLGKIVISKSDFIFYDSDMNLRIEAKNFRYNGKGDFAKDEFNLESNFSTGNFSFTYDGVKYLDQKNVKAILETGINTTSLNLRLLKNKVKVQDISAEFFGDLTIFEDGYDVDFNLKSDKSNFADLFSLVPQDYTEWLKNTKIDGSALISVAFKGSARDSSGLSPDLEVKLDVADGKISYENAPFPLEKIFLKGSLLIPGLDMEALQLNLDTLCFSMGTKDSHAKLRMKGFSIPTIDGELAGSLDLTELTRTIGLKAINMGGVLDYSVSVNGLLDLSQRLFPVSESSVRLSNGFVSTPKYPYPVKDLTSEVFISSKTGKFQDLKIYVNSFSFNFENKPFTLTAKLENFDNLRYDIKSNGNLNLDNIYKIFEIKDASIKGELLTSFALQGNQSDARSGKYKNLNNSGTLELKNFEYKSGSYRYPFRIPDAVLTFDRDKAWLRNARLDYNKNSISLDGYAQNFMGYYFEGGDLLGRLSVASPQIVLEDFVCLFEDMKPENPAPSDSAGNAGTSPEGVIQVPPHLDLSLKADVKSILFEEIRASNFSGEVAIRNGSVELRRTGMTLAGARFLLDAGYKPTGTDKAEFDFKVRADSFDIKRAYNEIPMFRELVSSAANMKGLVSTEYNLKGKLDQNMEPLYPSIKGAGFIRLEDVSAKGFKVLGAVSKATGRDSLDNPNLKAVLIKTTIANNIITIERTKMKIFGFRPRFEGQVSLDGKLNINFRLGLPPLGIIGIPMTITGTMDNPKVNMRKGKEGDRLEEETDESAVD